MKSKAKGSSTQIYSFLLNLNIITQIPLFYAFSLPKKSPMLQKQMEVVKVFQFSSTDTLLFNTLMNKYSLAKPGTALLIY